MYLKKWDTFLVYISMGQVSRSRFFIWRYFIIIKKGGYGNVQEKINRRKKDNDSSIRNER